MVKNLRLLAILVSLLSFSTGFCLTSASGRLWLPFPSAQNPALADKTAPPDSYAIALAWAGNSTRLARSAKTQNEWRLVTGQWRAAINLLRTVPLSHPRYKTAQAKVMSYQHQLADAERNLQTAPPQSRALKRPQRTKPVASTRPAVAKFMIKLRRLDPNAQLIADIIPGSTPDRLKLTLRNSFHQQPYQTRLKTAKGLWWMWASIYSPKNPDRAWIELLDFGGYRVGGSQTSGSLVEVKPSPFQSLRTNQKAPL